MSVTLNAKSRLVGELDAVAAILDDVDSVLAVFEVPEEVAESTTVLVDAFNEFTKQLAVWYEAEGIENPELVELVADPVMA